MQKGYKMSVFIMSVFPRLCEFVCFTARHHILEQLLTLGLGGLILHMLAQLLTLGGRILLTRRHETLHCLHENTIAGKNVHNMMSLPPLLTYSQSIRRRLPQYLLFCQAKSCLVWFGTQQISAPITFAKQQG